MPNDLLPALAARGRLAPQPQPERLPNGNPDRRPERAQVSWRVRLPDGRDARLTVGPDLTAVATRAAAFAGDCPAIVSAPAFHEILGADIEALAEPFFDGVTLDAALRDQRLPPTAIQAALTRIGDALRSTERPSTAPAREAEWRRFGADLCSLPVWTEGERRLLRDEVLPGLYPSVSAAPPATRWTNGDLIGANILVAPDGSVRLVDMEFAARTHFFGEDAARFHALSECARQQPALFETVIPDPGPAWHLFFWLRQVALESANNTSEYLARVRPIRCAVIRRLAEFLLGRSLAGWSVASTPVHHELEDARWAPSAEHELRLSGWCHVAEPHRLRHVAALAGGRRCALAAPGARPDVQAHFGGADHARNTGFVLDLPPVGFESELTLAAVTDDGALLPFRTSRTTDLPWRGPAIAGYTDWARRFDPDPPAPEVAAGSRKAERSNEAGAGSAAVRFSILLPVYNPPEAFLRACLDSVRGQHYRNWELCVVDDSSDLPHVRPLLTAAQSGEARIRVRFRETNGGISAASNDALAMAQGDFVVLLDHDDVLRPHALAELARKIASQPDVDAVYSDEDVIAPDGRRTVPFLKPDFSPEYLLGVMYVGHVLAVRLTVARDAGGFDPAYDGVQDYEFFLRVTERTRRVAHLPRILYHWRQSASSSAMRGNVKGDMDERQAAAVRGHLARTRQAAEVIPLGHHRVRVRAGLPQSLPTISILVAAPEGAAPAADAIRRILAAGDTRVAETLDDVQSGDAPADRLRRLAGRAKGDVLVFMTAIPAAASDDWLAEMASLAARDDAGAVTPIIITPDGRVAEAGRVVGDGAATPLMKGFDANGDGYDGSLCCNHETGGVSGLCFAVRRDRYSEVGGLRSGHDVLLAALDLCLRLEAAGRYNRVAGAARITISAPGSRGDDWQAHWSAFEQQWRERLGRPDPFYNPQFDAKAGDYRLAPVAAPRRRLQIHIDAPTSFDLAGPYLRLHGWCFAPGTALRAVRLVVPDREVGGRYGTFRPDVREALADAPDDRTGFELWTQIPAGHYQGRLQFQDDAGTWHEAASLPLRVPRWTLPAWLPGASRADLVAFQLGLSPAYAPRPLKAAALPGPRTPAEARPKISIVTPSFNQARFLERTIVSVLSADPLPAYVVQDGGSTDGSVDVIRRHSGRLHAWESARDQGQADAIARGFAKTSGAPDDLMAWLNADDFYLPGTLAFVADYFARHPQVDVVYGNRAVVDEQGREIRRWFLPAHDDALLRLNDYVPQETLFWRRRVWDRVSGVDTALQFAIDWDLLLRFQAAGARIVHVPHFLACFRAHPSQKTAAIIKDVGQEEIDRLRERAFGRRLSPAEIETHPTLISYLRRSARIECLWKLGIRTRWTAR